MKNIFKFISIIVIFIFCIEAVTAYEIKVVDSFKLSQKKIIAYAASLCVTEDELFLIPDKKLGHVKVFDNDGELVKILGSKGFGPDEFDRPAYSFYEGKKFGVYDMSSWRIHLYERSTPGKANFKRIKSIFCTTGITDVHFKGRTLFLAGFVQNKEGAPYCMFARDTELEKNELLLPAHYEFGFASSNEYKAKRNLPEILVGGGIDLVAAAGDFAYFAWEGDLSVVSVNLSTMKIIRFGYKSPHYIKPFLSKEFTKAYETRYSNPRAYGAARWKLSYVHDLFACDAFVLVIFRGPHKNEKFPPYTTQFYSLDGEYINEVILPLEWEWWQFFLDKQKNVLYAIAHDGENDEEYYIVKMQISNGK